MSGFIIGCVVIGFTALHQANKHNIVEFHKMSAIERACALRAYPAIWKFRPDPDRPFDRGERVAVRRAAKTVSRRFHEWIAEAYQHKYHFGYYGSVERRHWRRGGTFKRLRSFGVALDRGQRGLSLSFPGPHALSNWTDVVRENDRRRNDPKRGPWKEYNPRRGLQFIQVVVRGRHPHALGQFNAVDVLSEEPAEMVLYRDSIAINAEERGLPYYGLFEKVAAHEFMHAFFHGESWLDSHIADINHFMSSKGTEYDNYFEKGITIPMDEKLKLMRCFDEGHHAHWASVRGQRRDWDLEDF